ncbi:hypothetical protein EDC21_1447 [Thermohydrogenium kirishiense]|jgi:hypothetical protein|nr:hypothetical protein EDC21_1447 [Thermohydrogenium kirishiense]
MDIYKKYRNLLIKFSQVIYYEILKTKKIFLDRTEAVAVKRSKEFKLLEHIAEIYYLNKLPIPPREIATTCLEHPLDKKKTIEVIFF